MRIKILNHQDEKKINQELSKLEKDRIIEQIIPVGKKTWILHYEDNRELQNELKSIRNDFNELKKENSTE